MRTATVWTLGALLGVTVSAALAGAHPRNYVQTDVPVITCVDDQFTLLGTGGAAGGVLNTVGATADPVAPDSHGTCYRANHMVANLNGDFSVAVVDQVQSNVGFCLSQDSDGDGLVCDDEGDIQVRVCNVATQNINVPVPNAWRLQDGQGVPARRTHVTTTRLSLGTALLGPIQPACGEGVDAFAVAGTINHN